MHPRISRGVGVQGWAASIGRLKAQFVVPRFVSVDLAQPVRRPVLGQPRRSTGRSDVDRVSGHVRRRIGRGDPPRSSRDRTVLRDRLTKKLVLVRAGSPTALDEERHAIFRSVCCRASKGAAEVGTELRHGGVFVLEDGHAGRNDSVFLAGKTSGRAGRKRWRGDGRGCRRRSGRRLVVVGDENGRADEDHGSEDGASWSAGRRSSRVTGGHAFSEGREALSERM